MQKQTHAPFLNRPEKPTTRLIPDNYLVSLCPWPPHADRRISRQHRRNGFGSLFEKTLSNMQEVIARGGKVLLLTNSDGKVISENIRFQIDLPSSDLSLTPFIFTIPLQLLSYHVALFKKCDIDKPRNLAKSVTVE